MSCSMRLKSIIQQSSRGSYGFYASAKLSASSPHLRSKRDISTAGNEAQQKRFDGTKGSNATLVAGNTSALPSSLASSSSEAATASATAGKIIVERHHQEQKTQSTQTVTLAPADRAVLNAAFQQSSGGKRKNGENASSQTTDSHKNGEDGSGSSENESGKRGFNNVIKYSLLGLAAFYGGGITFSLINDDFRQKFKSLPLAEQALEVLSPELPSAPIPAAPTKKVGFEYTPPSSKSTSGNTKPNSGASKKLSDNKSDSSIKTDQTKSSEKPAQSPTQSLAVEEKKVDGKSDEKKILKDNTTVSSKPHDADLKENMENSPILKVKLDDDKANNSQTLLQNKSLAETNGPTASPPASVDGDKRTHLLGQETVDENIVADENLIANNKSPEQLLQEANSEKAEFDVKHSEDGQSSSEASDSTNSPVPSSASDAEGSLVSQTESQEKQDDSAKLDETPELQDMRKRVEQLEKVVKNATSGANDAASTLMKQAEASESERTSSIVHLSRDQLQVLLDREIGIIRRKMQEEVKELQLQHEAARKYEREQIIAAYKRELQARMEHQKNKLSTQYEDALLRQREWLSQEYDLRNKIALGARSSERLKVLESLLVQVKALEAVVAMQARARVTSEATQQLWLAATSFSSAAQLGLPLRESVEALRSAGAGNLLIQTVLESLSESVIDHGVRTQQYLTLRFDAVRQNARKASLVPEDGGNVLSHFLSALFSSLMFERNGLVPGDDVESILARSEHYLRHGDLDKAARQINQLKGWPRKIASDWLKEARARLEVEQAAEMLISYASMESI